jgi:tape measure domain-containing protein
VAQSTVKLIVDAQNAIRPLQRVNEQTKALSSSTDKLKGRLNRSNQSLRDTGRAAKTASAGVGTLVGALKPLLAALAVVGTARFIFFKTAELETQRASLKKLTDSAEKTNEIIQELQDFGAVTPFTSSELIEQTKRLKAFGFATEELVDTTKRLSDIAGATGADLTGIATAFGQIRAKGKLQQEENLQLLERGVDITTELKRITGLQGDEFESAMRKGKIGADLVNQALINLTSQGGIFAGGATAQADTLNGKLSTLQDTIDTLARTIGTELEDEIKGILDISIKAVKQISTLIESIGLVSKLGEKDMIKIETEARTFATEEVSKDFGFFERRFSADARKQFQEIFDLKKKELVSDALKTKELTKQKETQDKIKESVTAAKNEAAIINQETTLLNESLGQTDTAVDTISNSSNKVSTNIKKAISETDQLKEKFMEIGQSVEQGIVSNLTDAVMGTKTLAQAAISVLDNLKRKLIEVAIQKAVAGIGGKLGGFLGGLFGKRASGGPVAAGGAYLVGERGPEILQMGSRGGNIIPNSAIGGGGTTNVVTVNVDAKGSSVAGNGSGADALGQLIGGIVQQTLVKEQRAGGLLNR